MDGADWMDHWCDSDENWYSEQEMKDDWDIRYLNRHEIAAIKFKTFLEQEKKDACTL